MRTDHLRHDASNHANPDHGTPVEPQAQDRPHTHVSPDQPLVVFTDADGMRIFESPDMTPTVHRRFTHS